MNTRPPAPSWRKPAGMIAIIALVAFWAFVVASASPWIRELPTLVQAIIYLIAGIAWILPLRPLLIWMETGSFRAPSSIE